MCATSVLALILDGMSLVSVTLDTIRCVWGNVFSFVLSGTWLSRTEVVTETSVRLVFSFILGLTNLIFSKIRLVKGGRYVSQPSVTVSFTNCPAGCTHTMKSKPTSGHSLCSSGYLARSAWAYEMRNTQDDWTQSSAGVCVCVRLVNGVRGQCEFL